MSLTIKEFFKKLRLNEQKISQFLGGVVVVMIGVLIYNYFSGVNKQVEIAQKVAEETSQPLTHTVAPGEYLWDISVKYYNDGYQWTKIAAANNLVNPDLLTAGQVLVLPQIETSAPAIAEVIAEIPAVANPTQYTVAPGDDLWNISVKMYADGYQWTKIWEANKDKVTNANIIEVGQVLSIPR